MKNTRFTRLGLIAACGIFVMVSTVYAAPTSIKFTRHNLSNWGKYTVRATTETQVCIFCHAPHNTDSTDTPLWSHAASTATTFQMASTANVSPHRAGSWADATPTGISKKCLSCHDGTVAIGALATGVTIAVAGASGGGTLAGTDRGFIGTDLRGGHVISFDYNAFWNGTPAKQAIYNSWNVIITNDPKDRGMFDRNKKMHCHTCHDPHNDWCNDTAKTVGRDPLWRKPCDPNPSIGNQSVCNVCHLTIIPGPTFKKYSF